jgi:hypothetical protein
MIDIAKSNPSSALSNPAFIYDKNVALIFLAVQFVLLMVALYLSVFKPKIGPEKAKERRRQYESQLARTSGGR